jgi:Calx-beta domain/FG-GAP-like repeat/Domain of unknown function (DUF4214)
MQKPRPKQLLRLTLIVSTLVSCAALLAYPFSSPALADSDPCSAPKFRVVESLQVDGFHLTKTDLNGDGHLDLLVVSPSFLKVLLGNGDGTFQTPRQFDIGASHFAPVVGDFNNDGRLDVITGTNAFALQLGDGAGGFAPALIFTLGTATRDMAAGDFNLDGNLDVAAVFSNNGEQVLAIRLGDGQGGFGALTRLNPGASNFIVAVTVVDFNLDGKADLATTDINAQSVSVLLGDGTGQFGTAKTFAVGLGPREAVPADLNNDGKPDLVVPNSASGPLTTFPTPTNNISVLLGNGAGNFSTAIEVSLGEAADRVAVQDFNGDGNQDLVARPLSSSAGMLLLAVLLGDGTGRFGPPTFYNPGRFTEITIQAAGVVAGDFNEDGDTDVATSEGALLFGDGTGRFRAAEMFRALVNERERGPVKSATLGDFNGDGKIDVVSVDDRNPTLSLILGDGAGRFGAPRGTGIGTNPRLNAVAAGDFNDDGKQDLIVTDDPRFLTPEADDLAWVFPGDGAGNFEVNEVTGNGRRTGAVGNNPLSLAVADFNKDGIDDLAVAFGGSVTPGGQEEGGPNTINPASVAVALGDAAKFFKPSPFTTPSSSFLTSIVAADFDRDGNADVAVTTTPDRSGTGVNGVSVYRGDGAGNFAAPINTALPAPPGPSAVGDFNNDGKPDLVTTRQGNNVSVLLGNGAGGFGPPTAFNVGVNPGKSLAVADFNLDGNLDIANSGGSVISGDGFGGFTSPVNYHIQGIMILAGDFNLDGKPDLAHFEQRSMWVVLNESGDAISRPVVQFAADALSVAEGASKITVTVERAAADTSCTATVDYATSDGTASERKDYTTARGTLRFDIGETRKTFDVLITDDAFTEAGETINLTLSNANGAATLGGRTNALLTITDNDNPPPDGNPLDDTNFFVRQHYHDFLNREPDADGFQFWTAEIEQCGTDAQCREVKRINVSAAFFLSIEFQETGYLAYRTHKVAFGDLAGKPVPITRLEMLLDMQVIGNGLVVGPEGWELRLEQNKQAYFDQFVSSVRFNTAYPRTMTPEQFIDALNANAGGALSAGERDALVAALTNGTKTRAQALRAVAQDADLSAAEKNKAFVLMQYFGYLRRNPDDAPEPGLNFGGYNFWLGKLNEFNGNFVQAEMVKAFLDSTEYRNRFAP